MSTDSLAREAKARAWGHVRQAMVARISDHSTGPHEP
jgi:hypothetical protein